MNLGEFMSEQMFCVQLCTLIKVSLYWANDNIGYGSLEGKDRKQVYSPANEAVFPHF